MLVVSFESEVTPEKVCVGNPKNPKLVLRAFKACSPDVIWKKIKDIFPYGKGFSTVEAEIVPADKVLYRIGKNLYNHLGKEFIGTVISKTEEVTPRFCKYRMYFAKFSSGKTAYVVVPD